MTGVLKGVKFQVVFEKKIFLGEILKRYSGFKFIFGAIFFHFVHTCCKSVLYLFSIRKDFCL
jgi:hypothetical protein